MFNVSKLLNPGQLRLESICYNKKVLSVKFYFEKQTKWVLSLAYANKTRQIREDAYELGAVDRLLQNK